MRAARRSVTIQPDDQRLDLLHLCDLGRGPGLELDYDSDTSASNALWYSKHYYDGAGRLASVAIADGRARTISFASNPNGQVLSRIERSAALKNPEDHYYSSTGCRSAS